MYDILEGLRIVEAASFVAGPSSGLYLQQYGAEVIRLDPVTGPPDHRRWPLSAGGDSLFWEGLNKGKKSIAVDLSRPEGRELAAAVITAPGENAGLFVTNTPATGVFAHARLAALRADLISVRVMGWGNGTSAVDYTVNPAFGVPQMTGPADSDVPVNHVLPAWDLIAGCYAAFTLLAAERRRRQTGAGAEVRVALSDVAATTLANLGQVAEVAAGGDRPRVGNALFGAFGRDFACGDGRRIMVVAITPRQWANLVGALDIEAAVRELEQRLGTSFARDEGQRFTHREPLFAIVERAIGRSPFDRIATALDEKGVCWSPYRSLTQALREDPVFHEAYGLFETVHHPGGGPYATPGSAGRFEGLSRTPAASAPRFGAHTDEVLSSLLGLPAAEISRLHTAGVVAGPRP
ncbi:CoA transferase [Xanthobacter autotrophicus]|uniref:CoA transferase n=1 Tax=Xanthobacter autotrophicus TaxID=280 RepID=UPI00372B080F